MNKELVTLLQYKIQKAGDTFRPKQIKQKAGDTPLAKKTYSKTGDTLTLYGIKL